jgi:YVTN family beta-propeller protein
MTTHRLARDSARGLGFACALVGAVAAVASQAAGTALKKAAAFDLPGPGGKRFDYLAIVQDDRYLLSAHLGADRTYVIDMRTNAVVATVMDTPGVEGIEHVPELKKFYTSNSGDNTIGVVDMRTMKVVKKLPTEAKPDGSTYAAPFQELYVSDERGKAEAVVDVRTDTVVARYQVGRCQGNHGMALDPVHHRAFLACEGNNLLTVFNLDTHAPIAKLPLAAGPDVVKFDAGLGRIYVACSSGAISVFQADDADHYRKVEDFPVEKRVHTLAVDPSTHRVYAPEQEEAGKPVARMVVYDAVVKR